MFTSYHTALHNVTNYISDRAFVHIYYYLNTLFILDSSWDCWDSSCALLSDMWRYDPIQFIELNPIILMWTEHRINMEKLHFVTRETNNMDNTEEDILVIYINLINMINAFTNLQMDLIFSIRNYYKKNKVIRNILMTDTKFSKGNRLLESIG